MNDLVRKVERRRSGRLGAARSAGHAPVNAIGGPAGGLGEVFKMSEVFEGILVSAPHGAVAKWVREQEIPTPLRFDCSRLECGLVVVFREDTEDVSFSSFVSEVGARISRRFGRALVVRYDSHESHRSSEVYEAGAMVASFDGRHELFVLLGPRGMPLPEEGGYTRGDLPPDREFETCKNAIQLGLERLGVDAWSELFDLMTSQ